MPNRKKARRPEVVAYEDRVWKWLAGHPDARIVEIARQGPFQGDYYRVQWALRNLETQQRVEQTSKGRESRWRATGF